MRDPFSGLGVQIILSTDEDFLKIKETLERIGIASDGRLYQSCHILYKQGQYAIMHFKEMFALDGRTNTFSEEDRNRRNMIAYLLEQWKLCRIRDPKKNEISKKVRLKVIPYAERDDWQLISKYSIGKMRK